MVRSLGATQVIDYSRDDFTKNGQTYDIIFDTPAKSSFAQCKVSLKKKGKYLTTIPLPRVLWQMLWTSVASSKKVIFAPTGLRSIQRKTRDLEFLANLVASGQIKPVIDKVFTMEQIVEAYRYIDKGLKQGNVVISIGHV
jgi:NADPH:quinone reductase-like Zn-dependent oxidoreductase